MSKYTVILSDEEEKVLAGVCLSPEEWINNATHDRCRVAIDEFVTKSGRGSKMTEVSKKLEIIKDLEIPALADLQGGI